MGSWIRVACSSPLFDFVSITGKFLGVTADFKNSEQRFAARVWYHGLGAPCPNNYREFPGSARRASKAGRQ